MLMKTIVNDALDQEDRDNVLSFLNGVQTLRGVVYEGKVKEQIESGRRLIGTMASRAGLATGLNPAQCADVLCFIQCCESIEPLNWQSFETPNRVCGFMTVLAAVEKSLRDGDAGEFAKIDQPDATVQTPVHSNNIRREIEDRHRVLFGDATTQKDRMQLIEERIFEAQSISGIVRDGLEDLTGDEDICKVVDGPVCRWTYVLKTERRLLNEVVEMIELLPKAE